MKKIILICIIFLVPLIYVFAEGTDVVDNYTAGTHAGENLEIDATGFKASNNTFVGVYSGYADTTGSGNTGIGYGALRNVTTGIGNIGLGLNAGQDLTTETHNLYIQNGWYPAYGIFGDFSTGFFGINNKSPTVELDVTGAITASGTITGVAITATGAITFSDRVIMSDSLFVSKEQTVTGADSSLVVTVNAGDPILSFKAGDASTSDITVAANDTLKFQNASVYRFDNKLFLQNGETIDNATDGEISVNGAILANRLQGVHLVDADSTLTTADSGDLWVARPLTAKRTYTLPAAALGLTYDFMIADADSLLLTTASGDSLITSAGVAWKTTSSVAGTVRVVGIDATRWIMLNSLGTWTSY